MNKIIMLVAFATMLTQAAEAQVKRQYKDKKFVKQTVVVKEKASTSDLDILNSQFDLDDVSVGEVIRITTETDPKPMPEVVEEDMVALVEEKEEVTEIMQTSTSNVDPEPAPVTAPVRIQKTSSARSTASSSKRGYAKKTRSKKKNPRFKKKKRKRVKRSKNKCYRF